MPDKDKSDLFGYVADQAFGDLPVAAREDKVMNLAMIEALRSVRSAQDGVVTQLGAIGRTVHQIELQMVRFEKLDTKMDKLEESMNKRFGEVDVEIEGLKTEKHRRDGHAEVRAWLKPAFPWLAAAAAVAWAIAERLPPLPQ